MANANTEALRMQMINGQLRTSDVNDLDILAAFAAVPREDFVAPAQRSLAYADGEIAACGPAGRRLLAPRTLGLLLKSAAPVAGERALVVGGAGYCAALLAHLGLDVVELESEPTADAPAAPAQVARVYGALAEPPAGKGPYDVIVVNGAFEAAPDRLVAALNEGGRLVGVSARAHPKRIVVYERSGGGVSERALADAAGDVLPGFARAPAFSF